MADSKLKIWISDNVNLSGFQKLKSSVSDIKDRFEKMHRAIQSGFEASKKAISAFFAPLKTVAVPAIGAVATAFGLAIKAMKDWAGQELGERDIISALIAMGQYTDQYKDKLVGLANTYQESTGIADDYWLKSLGQLTRFGMNAENVDKVSEALKNLTGLMDGNIDSATDALAKALQGEFSMFSRFGIIVETSGDKIKDLDNLIKGINEKGTGLLEARADTLSGKFQALKNTISDMSEAAGKRLADGLDIGSAIETAKGKFATLMTQIQNGGLGDILEKAGEAFRKKIEGAVKWAEKIAEAIEKSGKPLDQVFGDALKGAARIFVETLTALIKASAEIWKVGGIALFNAFKEEIIKLPGFGGYRKESAAANAQNMPDSAAADVLVKSGVISKDLAANPDYAGAWPGRLAVAASSGELGKNTEASLATADAGQRIETAITSGLTQVKTAFDELVTKSKTIIEDAAGVKAGAENGTNGAASTITIQGSDGEEITMALDEYIAQLKEQNEKQAEAATAGTDALKASTETIEAIKTTSEAVKTSADAANKSNTAVQDALNTSKTVSQQTVLVAQRTQEDLNALIGMVAKIAADQTRAKQELAILGSQVRSMRA